MSFVSSSSQSSNKAIQELHLLDVCIDKPHTLNGTCPVETTTERLPLIEKKPRKKKEVKDIKKSSESEKYWLKSGISLPKLQSAEAPRPIRSLRQESSESSHRVDFNSVTLLKATDSNADKSHKHAVSVSLNCYKDLQKAESGESVTVCPDPVGPSASQFLFRVPSSELNFDEFKVEDEELEESHALRQWKHWLKEHRHLQEHLSKRLHRKKYDLQFQKAQNYRMRVEDRSLFFLAQIPEADKWRGHPFFWKSPNKIGGRENLLANEEPIPACYGVKTRLEKGEVPEMEFIGIPTVIKREKGLISGNASASLNLESNCERLPNWHDHIQDFREEWLNLKPHNIQMDGLQIVGTKIPQNQRDEVTAPAEVRNLPQIKVSCPQYGDSCSRDVYGDRSSVFWLSIGGKELEYEIGDIYCQSTKKKEVDLKWEIDFGVNTVGTLVERTLRVENKGTMAVEYNFLFRKLDEKRVLNSLQPKQHEPWFFFNKNPGIFLPGQIYELKFYHYAKRSGVRKETWNLQTQPSLSRNGQSGTIVLWAVSTGDSSDSAINALDSYLRKRVTQSTVGFILQVLIRKALNPLEELEGIEYRSLFLEKDLFEYQNPKHYYHSVIVKELHRIFEQIPCKNQAEWDMSIASLMDLIVNYVKGKEQDYLLRQISERAKKLLRPNRLLIKNVKKYRMTYEILCKMTNLLDEDYYNLRNFFVQRKEQGKRNSSEPGEVEEELWMKSEEKEMAGESWWSNSEPLWEIKPTNILFFQTMFFLKVYNRVSEAVNQMVGALETSKLSEPWKEIDPRLTKPARGGRE